jgi:hypothetical protein
MYKMHGLGDSQRLARAFENAYVEMMKRAQSSVTGQRKAATA